MKEQKEKLCELCKEIADYICFDCSFYLCDSCFEFIHEKEANAEHKINSIDPIVPFFLKCEKHPQIPISQFSIKEKRIYCQLCTGNNKNSIFGNKSDIIDIDDENSLKDSIISYDKTISQFYSFLDEVRSLKSSIENKIFEINISNRKINAKINKYAKYEHYSINRTRRELKNELNKRTEKAKEDLENHLSHSKNILLSLEKISKAILSFGDKNKSPLIRTWCYISEINKYNEKANNFLKIPKKTLIFTFNESNLSIDYTNYYFSGLPIPYDISVKKDENNKIEISWENEEHTVEDIYDKEKIEYEIEIKYNNKRKTFNSEAKILILDKLMGNKEYQIHIKTILGNSCSKWSAIQTFRSDDLKRKNDLNPYFSSFLPLSKTEINTEKKENKSLFSISLFKK